ncbi:phytanoyl- dioxygenase superfamily protein, partial [Cystoisospora suis]
MMPPPSSLSSPPPSSSSPRLSCSPPLSYRTRVGRREERRSSVDLSSSSFSCISLSHSSGSLYRPLLLVLPLSPSYPSKSHFALLSASSRSSKDRKTFSTTSSSSLSSPLASAVKTAAERARKRREEGRRLERVRRLLQAGKVSGAIVASIALATGGGLWCMYTFKRRHSLSSSSSASAGHAPSTYLDPSTSCLPRELAKKISITPTPLHLIDLKRQTRLSPSSPGPPSSQSHLLSPFSSSTSSFYENIFPSPDSLSQMLSSYPSFPVDTPETFLHAVSHVLPLELHLHLRDAFCRNLEIALIKRGREERRRDKEKNPEKDEEEEGEIKKIMSDIWLSLGLRPYQTFLSSIDFTPEIQAFVRSSSSSPSFSSSSSFSPSLDGATSGKIDEFLGACRDKISDILIASWQQQRYFDPHTYRDSRWRRTISREAGGRNIGTPIPFYSYADLDLHSPSFDRCRRLPSPSTSSSFSQPPPSQSTPSFFSSIVSFLSEPFSSSPSSGSPTTSTSPRSSSSSSLSEENEEKKKKEAKGDEKKKKKQEGEGGLYDEPVFLGSLDIADAVHALREYGVCIIRGGLTQSQLQTLQDSLYGDKA